MVLGGIQPIFLAELFPEWFYERFCEDCQFWIEKGELHGEKHCQFFQFLEEFKHVKTHQITKHMNYCDYDFEHREWIIHELDDEEIRVKYYKNLYFPQKSGRSKMKNKKRCGKCDTFGKCSEVSI